MSDFKDKAKAAGFFASGGNGVYRIAVRNKTGYKRVAAFAENVGATIAPTTGTYPELTKLTIAAEGSTN